MKKSVEKAIANLERTRKAMIEKSGCVPVWSSEDGELSVDSEFFNAAINDIPVLIAALREQEGIG